MKEYIILPAAPQFSDAIENSDTSETLVEIESFWPWQQVATAALRGNFTVTSSHGYVESHNPVRVRLEDISDSGVSFQVDAPNGRPFGLTPIVIAGLAQPPNSYQSAVHGLWMKNGGPWAMVNQSVYSQNDYYQVCTQLHATTCTHA